MNKVKALRGAIYERFDSESEFAQEIGWPRQKLNRITTGKREPTITEVNEISVGLGIPLEKVASFFTDLVTKWGTVNIRKGGKPTKKPIYRNICFSIGETRYFISFRTALFGRVKNVRVYSRKGPGYLYHLDNSVKVEPQNISAVQALKRSAARSWKILLFFCGGDSGLSDIEIALANGFSSFYYIA